mgnify:CR=1 FL=1
MHLDATAIDQSHFFDNPKSAMSRRASKAQARHDRRQEKTKQRSAGYARQPLEARNENQADFLESLRSAEQVFAIGPAGVGKTYLAARVGIRAVLEGTKDKVMIARATAAKSKHKLGFRPGDQNAKIADWMVPVMDGFKAEVSAATIESLTKAGKIEFLAFETMQGRSLPNAFVILDEAQNCDLDDLRLFLTRIGDNSVVVVCGDHTQVGMSGITDSGLERVVNMVDDFDIEADVIEFTEDDVVRSATAKAWVKAFARLTG